MSNIGYATGGAHAIDPNSVFAGIEAFSLKEIIHPLFIIPDEEADEFFSRMLCREQMSGGGLLEVLKKFLGRFIR